MDNIPDLSYDSIDRLETDSSRIEDEPHITPFNSESIRQFKNKWDAILEKYAQIDDSKQSDEIDLDTGEIITDNGHLRSLKSVVEFQGVPILTDVWSVEAEHQELRHQRDERKRKVSKRHLKEHLKETNRFYNASTYLSPTKQKTTDLEDNMRLVSPSPTKRNRRSPFRDGSSESDSELESPTKRGRRNPSTPDELQTSIQNYRSSSPLPSWKDKSIMHQKRRSSSSSSTEEISINSDFDDGYLVVAEEENEEDDGSNAFVDDNQPQSIECAFPQCDYFTCFKLHYQRHLLERHSQALSDVGYPVTRTEVDNGDGSNDRFLIDENVSKALDRYFPLVHRVPPLPLTPNCVPLKCTQIINGRQCRKTFITEQQLAQHEENAPLQCSSRRQVYMCPVLGCGFMVEGNYLEFRQHFIDAEHHIVPKYRKNYVNKKRGSLQKAGLLHREHNHDSEVMPLGSMDSTGYDSIDELFSS